MQIVGGDLGPADREGGVAVRDDKGQRHGLRSPQETVVSTGRQMAGGRAGGSG